MKLKGLLLSKLCHSERSEEPNSIEILRPFGPQNDETCGQTMIEFSFSMIVVVVLLLALIKVFVWSGKDLALRRQAHEHVLTDNTLTPEEQIRPVFYYSTRFNAAVDSDIYGR